MSPEEIYLGSIILRSSRYYEFDVTASDFLSPKCRQVFKAIGAIMERGDAVDIVTVVTECPGIDPVWLASLTDEITPNVRRIADEVIENSRAHRLALLAREAAERIKQESSDEVVEFVEQRLSEISEGRTDDVAPIKPDVLSLVEEFERRYRAHGEIPGISSGMIDIDKLTLGWGKQRYVVVGARPSEGKSALLLNFALAAAVDGVPVGVVTLESSRHEFLERAFANVGGIDGNKLRTGFMGSGDLSGMGRAANVLQDLPIYIADKPNMRIAEVKSRARRMVRQFGVRMLLIDYIQLIQTTPAHSDYERVSEVSMALKNLSRELDVPVIAAAQLNRSGDERKAPRKPRLSDFKNSGQIEQDADTAILIFRRVKDHDEQTWLCVEKNRDGATGDVQVWFDKPRMRFTGHQAGYD